MTTKILNKCTCKNAFDFCEYCSRFANPKMHMCVTCMEYVDHNNHFHGSESITIEEDRAMGIIMVGDPPRELTCGVCEKRGFESTDADKNEFEAGGFLSYDINLSLCWDCEENGWTTCTYCDMPNLEKDFWHDNVCENCCYNICPERWDERSCHFQLEGEF